MSSIILDHESPRHCSPVLHIEKEVSVAQTIGASGDGRTAVAPMSIISYVSPYEIADDKAPLPVTNQPTQWGIVSKISCFDAFPDRRPCAAIPAAMRLKDPCISNRPCDNPVFGLERSSYANFSTKKPHESYIPVLCSHKTAYLTFHPVTPPLSTSQGLYHGSTRC